MIYRENKHRVMKELDKMRSRGQVLHFLTGDGINDNFFYDVHDGIKNLADTLRDYYLRDVGEDAFDYFICVSNSNSNKTYFAREGDDIRTVAVDGIFRQPNRISPLMRRNTAANNNAAQSAGENVAESQGSRETTDIQRLNETFIGNKNKKYLLLLENLEWIEGLHTNDPSTAWIAMLKSWERLSNVMVVVTIKDMELLQKYGFNQEEIFIGYPSADEICYSYIRHILRNTPPAYQMNMRDLSDIAHSMSVGKKTLHSCMIVLRNVLLKNRNRLNKEDFSAGIEKAVEEEVKWQNVRLPVTIKQDIERAIDNFLSPPNADERSVTRKGILLTGPPGTGKTMIAKALATEKHCHFMAPTLADLKAEYVGQSGAKIKRVFSEARANEPTILFIDEADTVFPSRNLGAGMSDSFGLDMVNQFLQEIDGATTGLQRIFVIAATNRPDVIDGAIKSRLGSNPIEIALPDKETRRLIFMDNFATRGFSFELRGKSYEDYLLDKSEKMAGRDIKNFVGKLPQGLLARLKDDALNVRQELAAVFMDYENTFINDSIAKGIFTEGYVIPPRRNRKRLENIIGYDRVKQDIERQIAYITATAEQKREYARLRIDPPKGILLYGPPGNGKSELVEAVAGEHGFYFIKIISQDFTSPLSKEQIDRLDSIFSQTVQLSKMTDERGVVLFFDEFDSLAGVSVLGQEVRGSLLNYLSDNKDNGLRNINAKVLFVAATNNVELIDEAVKRKGRIDSHLFMDNPTEKNGTDLLMGFANRENVVGNIEHKFFEDAYRRLYNEKKSVYTLQKYGGPNWRDALQEENRHIIPRIEADINSQRPSGADLKNLYNELKDIAFHSNFMEDDKLVFNVDLLNRRFGTDGK